MPKDPTAVIGVLGGLGSLSLSQWNDAIGILVGALTAAYLLRKHWHLGKQPK